MKTWTRLGIGIAALALAVAIGTAAYAMSGSGDEPAAVVAEDAADVATDGDAPQEGEGLGLSAICIEGAEDCVDTVDVPYGDFGELPAKCAAEAVDCVEPGCAGVTITDAAPPDELVDPVPTDLTAEEELQADLRAREEAAERERSAQAAECVNPLPICEEPTMSACVPRDCLVMADGSVVCGANPPPDCAVSSDGTISCPDPAEPIDCTPVEPAPGDEFTTLPCVVEPCVGGPAVDCAPVEPCVPGPATDCGVIDCPTGIDPAVDVPTGAPPPCIEPGISTEPGAAGGGTDDNSGSGDDSRAAE